MTYSSIYPFYYCSSSKHTHGESPNGEDCFEQVAALTSTVFNPNEWKVKSYYSHAGLGISHGADVLVAKEPVVNLLSFSSPYEATISFNSASMDSQVKIEEPELLPFDALPQETILYGNSTQDINTSSSNIHSLSHRKYSIESVPGLYRDTCSPFGNYPGENSSSENSPQPFFGEPEFISSPIIQSPRSPGSYMCLEDSVFSTSTMKETSDTHHSNIAQQSSPVYASSLVSSQQTVHMNNAPHHHPYYRDDLAAHCPSESANYEKISHILSYNISVDPELHHTACFKKRMCDDTRIKAEEYQSSVCQAESMQSGLSKPMAAGQRNRSSNRPPTSMMTTFSSRITSPSAKRYHCSICQKGFSRPSSLNTHMYSHTGEKPFQCPYEGCGRHFSVVSNLRRHTKIHNGKAG